MKTNNGDCYSGALLTDCHSAPCLPGISVFQPASTKRFAAEDEGRAISIDSPPSEKISGKREKREYFNIIKNEPMTSETVKDKKAIRAAKNRMFAKESRQRKQLYIRDMENQLKVLRLQLEEYKQRQSKFDLVERHLKPRQEVAAFFEAFTQILVEDKDVLSNNEAFVAKLKRVCLEWARERQKVIETLSTAIIDLLLPIPIKMPIWMKSNGVDMCSLEAVQKLVHEKVPHECVQDVERYVRSLYLNKEKPNEGVECLFSSGLRMKKLIKKIEKCSEMAQSEVMKICNFVNKNIFEYCDLNSAGNIFKITSQLALAPELSNSTICKLLDTDSALSGK